jgi:hypothetical protein
MCPQAVPRADNAVEVLVRVLAQGPHEPFELDQARALVRAARDVPDESLSPILQKTNNGEGPKSEKSYAPLPSPLFSSASNRNIGSQVNEPIALQSLLKHHDEVVHLQRPQELCQLFRQRHPARVRVDEGSVLDARLERARVTGAGIAISS